jgi:predicted ribosome quality control (RQC) complex YloA/Tae2 family protein
MDSDILLQVAGVKYVAIKGMAFLGTVPFFSALKLRRSGRNTRATQRLVGSQQSLLPPPPLDYTSVAALVHSVKRRAIPGRLETVLQPDGRTIYLGLRTQECSRVWLTLSWHPQLARLTAVPEPRKARELGESITCGIPKPFQRKEMAYSVTNILRSAEYRDLILSECRLPVPFERVVELHLARRPGEPPAIRIFVELFGTRSNVVVLGNTDQEAFEEPWKILACGYQLAATRSERPFRIGERYELPSTVRENSPRLPILYKDKNMWRQRLLSISSGDFVWRGLTRAFIGLGTALAQELVSSTLGPDGLQRLADDLRTEEWDSLFRYWLAWLETLEQNSFVPRQQNRPIIAEADKKPRERYSMVLWPSMPRPEALDASDLIARVFERCEVRAYAESLAKRLRRELNTKLNRVRNALQQYQSQLAEAGRADQLRIRGDLLMAWQHLWKPGQEVLVPPPDALSALDSSIVSDQITAIQIAPGRTPVDEARAYYQRSRKLRRAVEAVAPLEASARLERERLEQLEFTLSIALDYTEDPDFELLRDIALELGLKDLFVHGSNERAKRSQVDRRLTSGTRSRADHLLDRCIQVAAVTEGAKILCGKSQQQNDYLTFQIAGDTDLWFHAQGFAGSHCILRMPPGISASTADLERASDVAAYYSKARLQKSVPVVYTQAKYVRKAGIPGLVKYSNERVLFGEPDRVSKSSTEATMHE